MSGFTPGPWTATDNTHLNGAWWIEFDSFCSIAEVRNGGDDGWDGKPYPGTPEANARLIAAAPELLDALEQVDMMFSSPGSINKNTVRDRVRLAISKAREGDGK